MIVTKLDSRVVNAFKESLTLSEADPYYGAFVSIDPYDGELDVHAKTPNLSQMGYLLHMVRDTDELDNLAANYYEDFYEDPCKYWKLIWYANPDLQFMFDLSGYVGKQIVIPIPYG